MPDKKHKYKIMSPTIPISVLILQGPASGFCKILGNALEAAGCRVTRINFSAADWIFWNDRRTLNFRGGKQEWPAYIASVIKREAVTHVLYYADRLPYHQIAADVARKMNVLPVSYELGYLRPDWIVVEMGGQSSYSHFPDDIKLIRRLSESLPAPDLTMRYPSSFWIEALHELFVK